jgi:hypothetical protein
VKFSRRRLLKGLGGVAVMLPWLESFDRVARGQPDEAITNVFWWRAGCGVAQEGNHFINGPEPERFWPRDVGRLEAAILADRDADRAVAELAPYAERMLMVRGLDLPHPRYGDAHTEAVPQVLTGSAFDGSHESSRARAPSADWLAARALHPDREPLVLSTSAYQPAQLSWRAPGVRADVEGDPARLLARVVGLDMAPEEVVSEVGAGRRSVNDLVLEDFRSLLASSRLSSADRRRLEQHRDAIRSLETATLLGCGGSGALAERASSVDFDDRAAVARVLAEVIAFAFACGFARSGSFQFGESTDQTAFDLGTGERLPSHWISHRIRSNGGAGEGASIPDAHYLHHLMDRAHLRVFRHFLEALASYESPRGTLLDTSVVTWLNDLGEGGHNSHRAPWLIVGDGTGRLRTGRFVDVGREPVNRAIATTLAAAGVRVDGVGDPDVSSEPFADLLA